MDFTIPAYIRVKADNRVAAEKFAETLIGAGEAEYEASRGDPDLPEIEEELVSYTVGTHTVVV